MFDDNSIHAKYPQSQFRVYQNIQFDYYRLLILCHSYHQYVYIHYFAIGFDSELEHPCSLFITLSVGDTMLSNESINFRNVAFCVRNLFVFFCVRWSSFFSDWMGRWVCFHRPTKIRQQKYLDSKFDCLAAIVMEKNDVSTNCTVSLYMFDLFLRRNLLCWFGWIFLFQLHVRVFFEENNWNTEVVKMIVWFEFHYAQMYMFYANENVHVW